MKRENKVKHIIYITIEKLDYYVKSHGGKDNSIIHDALYLIQLLLTVSNSEAILTDSEWAVCLISGYGELLT